MVIKINRIKSKLEQKIISIGGQDMLNQVYENEDMDDVTNVTI
jgi:hypothetical protein